MRKFKIYKFDETILDFKQINILRILLVSGIVASILILLCSFMYTQQIEKVYVRAEKEIVLKTSESFSKEKLIEDIKEMPFVYKDVVYAQCIIETGNFKSPVFKENFNLLGMRQPTQRASFSKGSNLGHAVFKNYRQCLYDRLIYDARYTSGLSRTEYLKYLGQVYAEAPGYAQKIEQVIKQNNIKKLFNEQN